MKRPVQAILGIVAPTMKRISPSQRELVRRAGTYLSPGQRTTARRRAIRDEQPVVESVEESDGPIHEVNLTGIVKRMPK